MFLVLSVISLVLATAELYEIQKYRKNDINILGDIYSVGLWDLRFNESLYGYQGFGSSQCFGNRSCRSSELACDPCDWTDPQVCSGVLRGPNSSCPCWPQAFICHKDKYPYPTILWTETNSTKAEIRDGGIVDVIHHPLPPDNCSCIIYKVDVWEGKIEGVLLYDSSWIGGSGNYILSRHGTVTICPSDPSWGQTRVVRFIGLGPRFPNSKIHLSVEYKPIPQTVYHAFCEGSSSHQCVPTNVLTRLSPLPGQSFLRVVIDPVIKCGVLGFWASSNEHLFSSNPWVSPKNSTGAYRTHRRGTPDGRPWPSIYPYCLGPDDKLYAYILSSTPVEFFIDTSKEWMLHRSFEDVGRAEFFQWMLGSATVECGTKSYTAHRDSYAFSEDIDTGSANVRTIYPSDDLDVFFPPPMFASDPYRLIKDLPFKPINSNRVVVSILLNQRLIPRTQPLFWTQSWFQNSYEWVTPEEWTSCKLILNGKITDRDGNELRLTINSDNLSSAPVCDPAKYFDVSTQIEEIQEETFEMISLAETSLSDIYRLAFLQDRLRATNEFHVCEAEMQSYYAAIPISDRVLVTDQCLSKFGTDGFNSDPCCQLDPTTKYDSCVVEARNLSGQFKIQEYTSKVDNCPTKQCARSSLTNLLLQFNARKDPTTCSSFVDRVDDRNIYWQCVGKIWGPEPVTFAGPNCTHDVDCPGSLCGLHARRCFVNVEESEIKFIDCVYDGLTQFSRTYISQALNLNPADSQLKDKWRLAFSSPLLCSDPFTPVGYDVQLALYGRCQGCSGFVLNTSTYLSTVALSPGASWPSYGYDCWAPGSLSCSISNIPYNSATFCEIKGCNHLDYNQFGYFPFLSAASFCSNKTFCGVSDDNFFYEDVTKIISLASCTNATFCILANGSKIQTLDDAECLNIYSCDAGNSITDETSCISSGSCSDRTDYDVGIWTKSYQFETGGCFFTIRYKKPFNPTASVCEPPFRNTILGCSVYPSVSPINQSSCVSGDFQWGDRSIFELVSPRWLVPAHDEQTCSDYGVVCDDRDHPQAAGLATYTNTLSFRDQCLTSRDLFHWTPGRWLPGQPRKSSVTIGKLSPRWSNASRTGLNLPMILSNLTKAVEKLDSLKIQSSAFCRNSYKNSLDELVCSCLTGYNESSCYQKKINISHVGVACADDESLIFAGDLELKFSPTSLPPASCDNLYISTSSIVDYQSRAIIPLRTLLVNYQEDNEYAIRNEQLGIYGKILTNGYSLSFMVTIRNVNWCVKMSELRQNYKNDKYPNIDLAKRETGSHPDSLKILNVNVSVINDQLCAEISLLETDVIYYFVQMVDGDYRDVKRSVFSTGEFVYVSFLLALYCLALGLLILKAIWVLYLYLTTEASTRLPLYRTWWIMFLMGCFFIFRVILFAFLVSQSLLGSESARAINYVLFEFPILLYFTFVSNYMCVWLAVMIHSSKMENKGLSKRLMMANYGSVFLSLCILVLFVIIIILFEVIIDPPRFICGGSIFWFETAQSYILLLAYRIIFSTIAIVLGILLFLAAIQIGMAMEELKDELSWWSRSKMYIIAVAGGLGLIGQAIYFLIVTTTESTPYNYASLTILLFLEIIPAFLFIFIDQTKRTGKKSSAGLTRGLKIGSKNSSGTTDRSKNGGSSDKSVA